MPKKKPVRKPTLNELLVGKKYVKQEANRFRKWFKRNYGYKPEESKNKLEVARGIQAYLHADPVLMITKEALEQWQKSDIEKKKTGIAIFDIFAKNAKCENLNPFAVGEGFSTNPYTSETMKKSSDLFNKIPTTLLGNLIRTREGQCVAFTSLYLALAKEVGIGDKIKALQTPYHHLTKLADRSLAEQHVTPVFVRKKGTDIIMDTAGCDPTKIKKGKYLTEKELYALALVNLFGNSSGKERNNLRDRKTDAELVKMMNDLAPNNPFVIHATTQHYINEGDYANAKKKIRHLEGIEDFHAKDYMVSNLKEYMYGNMSRFTWPIFPGYLLRALKHCDKLNEMDPNNINVVENRNLILYRLKLASKIHFWRKDIKRTLEDHDII
jgi:hypothetical protein